MEQLSFFESAEASSFQEKINVLETKIKNLRMGLFKRYSECEKVVKFLEEQVEDLWQEYLTK